MREIKMYMEIELINIYDKFSTSKRFERISDSKVIIIPATKDHHGESIRLTIERLKDAYLITDSGIVLKPFKEIYKKVPIKFTSLINLFNIYNDENNLFAIIEEKDGSEGFIRGICNMLQAIEKIQLYYFQELKMQTFHGDHKIKEFYVERTKNYKEVEKTFYNNTVSPPHRGEHIRHIINQNDDKFIDYNLFELELGIPAAIGSLIDRIHKELYSFEERKDFFNNALSSIKVGIPNDKMLMVLYKFYHWLLSDNLKFYIEEETVPILKVINLFKEAINGTIVLESEWLNIRNICDDFTSKYAINSVIFYKDAKRSARCANLVLLCAGYASNQHLAAWDRYRDIGYNIIYKDRNLQSKKLLELLKNYQ